VDTGSTLVKVRVSWPAIRPSNVDGWTPSDPLHQVATIRMRTYRQAEWFLTHNVAIPAVQSGVDPFAQSYDLRVDPSRMIECQVSILTASGRSVNATAASGVAAQALDIVLDHFRLSDTPDVAWPALGSPVTAAFRYSLPAVPASVLRQVTGAGDALGRPGQGRGQAASQVVVTVTDGAGRQVATDSKAWNGAAPITGVIPLARQVPEGSTLRYTFEVLTARGRLALQGEALVYSVYSHATKTRPAAEAFAAPALQGWAYRRAQ
jgi:hypothetical protein